MNKYKIKINKITEDTMATKGEWLDSKTGYYKKEPIWITVNEEIVFEARDENHAITKIERLIREKWPNQKASIHENIKKLYNE